MKIKKRVIILCTMCIIILIGTLIADKITNKEYFKELKYNEVIEKMNNKETFTLCLSQTTCTHCMAYKPKLSEVAKKYKLNIYYLEINLLNEEEEKNLKKYINYSTTPQTLFIINGEEKTIANRLDGDVSKDKIIKKLKSNGFIK